jgi:hypothetical protein
MSKRKAGCSADGFKPPKKLIKVCSEQSGAALLRQARETLRSAEWLVANVPDTPPVAGNILEMMFNIDADVDVPDLFEMAKDVAPNFDCVLSRIAPGFSDDDSNGRERAGFHLLKYIPTTPAVTQAFSELYWHWRNTDGDRCRCKNHESEMGRLFPLFWHAIDTHERVVAWASTAK